MRVAQELRRRMAAIPGIADAHLQQEVAAPEFLAEIDRTRAAQLGLNANQIATNLNISLSSSEQVSPNFWTDPKSGIPYYLAVQTPEHRVASLNALADTPVSASTTPGGEPVPGLLGNVATLTRATLPTNANQTNVQPVYEIYANVQGRDLGSISQAINGVVAELQKQLSPGNSIEVLGQIRSMDDAFHDLGTGLLFAAVLVYLLMVVNYQNFGDPFVVILALPATFCGIVVMLYITGTTLSVPSLMGAIMAVGVASANSILLVTFAREQQLAGMKAFDAAIAAGRTRIRPVLMTAAAMIVGMIPMAIGGAGEEARTPRWRVPSSAGCSSQTPTTLFIVPYLFARLRKRNDGKRSEGVFAEGNSMNDIEHVLLERLESDLAPLSRAAVALPGRDRPSHSGRRLRGLSALLLLGAGLALGVWRHDAAHRDTMVTAAANRDFMPTVRVEAVRASPSTMSVTLPATTNPFEAANIYARASGYVAKRNVDIGSQREGRGPAGDDHRPRARPPDRPGKATLAQVSHRSGKSRPTRELARVTWDRDPPRCRRKGGSPNRRATPTG